jgi:hypothetical protein
MLNSKKPVNNSNGASPPGHLTERHVQEAMAPYPHQILRMDRKNLLRDEDFDQQRDYSE